MIYFAQTPSGSIKIGCTVDLDGRLQSLESYYGQPLALLGTMRGGRKREAKIHGRFAHLRLRRTEQFRPGPDLMAFIGKPLLVGVNPDAIEAIEPRLDYIQIHLSEEDREQLGRIAKSKGLNMAAYSRMAVLDRLRKDREELDS